VTLGIWRRRALLTIGLLGVAGADYELWAQKCDPTLRAVPSSTGYRARSYGCEGLYIGLQSAPLAVQVVSFLKGGINPNPGGRELRLLAPPGLDLANYAGRVQVVGRARESNLNWALHGTTSADGVMRWDLAEVVIPANLKLGRLGIHGHATRRSGVGPPMYVPLAVVPEGATVATSDSLELVLRILEAAETCVAFADHESCSSGLDSYFTFQIPPGQPSQVVLQVRWRRRLQPTMGEPELIRIYRW
jgi:hypothetical protein